MCGINGYISNQETALTELQQHITVMNNMIIHRGPDDDGVFKESNNTFSLIMGMRRLSIIDLSSEAQINFPWDWV